MSRAVWYVAGSAVVAVAWLLAPLAREGVWAANGLDAPVQVAVDDRAPVTVNPGESTKLLAFELGATAGVHRVRATRADGRVLDEALLPVRGGHTSVYNVLGTAPLYVASVVYSKNGDDQGPEPDLYAGRAVVYDAIDYPFVEPPKTLELDSSSSSVTRTHLGLGPQGWRSSFGMVDDAGRMELLQNVHDAEPDLDASVSALVNGGFLVVGRETALHLADRLEAMPVTLAGLRAAHAAKPEDATIMSSLGLMLPARDAEALYRGWLADHPKNAEITRALAHLLVAMGRADEAIPMFADLPVLKPPDTTLAEALVMVGRAKEAVDLVDPTDPDDALFRARIERLAGGAPATDTPTTLADAETALYCGDGPLETLATKLSNDDRQKLALQWWAMHDPAKAWKLMTDADEDTLSALKGNARILIGLEFWRAGDPLLGLTLVEPAAGSATEADWAAILDPDAPLPPIVEHGSGSLQGVAALMRSRVLASRGRTEEARAAQERALKLEAVPGVVHIAAANWPTYW
jgi:tetratricopeptide (TPR) repeat protein